MVDSGTLVREGRECGRLVPGSGVGVCSARARAEPCRARTRPRAIRASTLRAHSPARPPLSLGGPARRRAIPLLDARRSLRTTPDPRARRPGWCDRLTRDGLGLRDSPRRPSFASSCAGAPLRAPPDSRRCRPGARARGDGRPAERAPGVSVRSRRAPSLSAASGQRSCGPPRAAAADAPGSLRTGFDARRRASEWSRRPPPRRAPSRHDRTRRALRTSVPGSGTAPPGKRRAG
jgi:hypothetical protein